MKIFFGEKYLDGIRILYNEPNRKLVGDDALLADFDVMAMAASYLKKSGVELEVSGRQERACISLWNNFIETMNNGPEASKKFYSMQGAKEKLYVQAMLLNAVNERILKLEQELVAASTQKSKTEKANLKTAKMVIKSENGNMVEDDAKAVYKKNRDEAVALWGALGAKVLKNYYDYQMAVNNNNGEPKKEVVVNGKNISDIIKKLYHGKYTKVYAISNYGKREETFERELPKLVAESRRDLMTPLHGIYDVMVREINFGRVDSYVPEDESDPSTFMTFPVEDDKEKKSSKFAKRAAAGVLAASMMFNSVGYPVSQIMDGFKKSESPISKPDDVVRPDVPEITENENIVITDNPDMVSPNPAEDSEKEQDNIGENGTIIPNEEPKAPETPSEEETTQPETPDKNPEYDMPSDSVPDENKTNNNKGNDNSEDFWFMN